MGKRKGSLRGVFIIGLASLAAVAAGWWMARMPDRQHQPEATQDEPADRQEASNRVVHLYFADENSRHLRAEQRILREPGDATALVQILVDALIQGPRNGTGRTLPGKARLESAFILDGGKAVLNFSADAFEEMPGGVGTELLSVYSIVNTLVLNVDSIQSIKFLIGGREARSLAGHVDIQQPFKANMLWVR